MGITKGQQKWAKGQTGNPAGRPRRSPEVQLAITKNGELAVQRMTEILEDDAAFGKDGWLPPKDQITLLDKAQDRALGKAETLSISHTHSGQIEHQAKPERPSLKSVKGELPEKKIIDVTPKTER